MSKILRAFGDALLKENMFKKLFANQTPGKRIAPPQTGNNDQKYQLRLDAGEKVEVDDDAVDERRKSEEVDKGGKGKGKGRNVAMDTGDAGKGKGKSDKDGKDANKGKKKTMKNIYLQINSKAKNESLKNFRGKHGSHANLGSAPINPQTVNNRYLSFLLWGVLKEETRNRIANRIHKSTRIREQVLNLIQEGENPYWAREDVRRNTFVPPKVCTEDYLENQDWVEAFSPTQQDTRAESIRQLVTLDHSKLLTRPFLPMSLPVT